jgi:hypothetical protein
LDGGVPGPPVAVVRLALGVDRLLLAMMDDLVRRLDWIDARVRCGSMARPPRKVPRIHPQGAAESLDLPLIQSDLPHLQVKSG